MLRKHVVINFKFKFCDNEHNRVGRNVKILSNQLAWHFFWTFYIADQEMISFNFLNQYLNFRKLGQSFTIFAENRNLGQSIIYLPIIHKYTLLIFKWKVFFLNNSNISFSNKYVKNCKIAIGFENSIFLHIIWNFDLISGN